MESGRAGGGSFLKRLTSQLVWMIFFEQGSIITGYKGGHAPRPRALGLDTSAPHLTAE